MPEIIAGTEKMNQYILEIIYLIASVTFVVGLKMLSAPETARRGNLWAAFGMTLAIAGTIFLYESKPTHKPVLIEREMKISIDSKSDTIVNEQTFIPEQELSTSHTSREPIKLIFIFGGILLGTVIGWATAKKVKMTAMPELVSLFNGMGGACAALISLLEFHHNVGQPGRIGVIMAGMIIGSVSFSGSIIAFMKLNGTLKNLNMLKM